MDKIIGVNWCKCSAELFVSQLQHFTAPLFSTHAVAAKEWTVLGTKKIFEIVEPCEGNLNKKKQTVVVSINDIGQ